MTVDEYLGFMYELKRVTLPREAHLNEICALVKIEDVRRRLIKNLSKGYKQRVGLAQALIGNPPVLILDEPTVGLDPQQIIEIRNLISRLGKRHTVILSSHILSEVQAVCERIIVINKGKIVADGDPHTLARELSPEHGLVAVIRGEKNKVQALLNGIDGVARVTIQAEREPGAWAYAVEPKDGCDVREQLFYRLAQNQMPLLSLQSNEMTLEDLFLKLTSEETPAAGARKEKSPILSGSKEGKR